MTARAGALLVLIWLSVPSHADAQVWTLDQDRKSVGLSLGRASDADSGSGVTWNGTFELPTVPSWRLRADVGRVHWRFGENLQGFPQRSTMTRASIGVTHTPPVAPLPVFGFVGGGAGIYWFPAPNHQGFTRFGMHALAGLEVMLPGERAKIVGEVRLDLLRSQTIRVNELDIAPLQGSAMLGVRWIWN
jgi:hypothetical protein